MTRARSLGVILIVAGLAMLLVAPQAQSCVTDFDATVCEATGTIVLKVVGLALVVVAAIVLVRHEASAKGSGEEAR
jgi:drug/metabolite transporter (DMT)-like permease